MNASVALWMTTVAMIINIGILIPVCAGIFRDTEHMGEVYGIRTPARDILLSMYLSILIMSAVLVVLLHISSTQDGAKWAACGLMGAQVVYKVLTPVLVKGGVPRHLPFNPVVASNLAAAVYHGITVIVVLISQKEKQQ
eukprot:TRINITY_DN39538_c0_g1_i1.p2 TRINITY_DN39538_c0_g1~~TRINITY_DN39538_c0_g1_i1.p2  ORF type:complete len:139 (-),score=19.79 TRINITY_DN39538_c0_g1_i1:185-601(-)